MRKRLRNIFQNNLLLKVTSQNGAGVLVKLLTGLAASKIIAVFIGPSGMALLANLQNVLASITNISTLGLKNGAIRYAAEHKNEPEKFGRFVSTLFCIGFVSATIIGLLLFFGSGFLSELVFPEKDFRYIFKLLAFVLPLSILNIFCVSILNGIGEFKKVILINIFGNILNLLLIAFLVWQYGLSGALVTVVILPSSILFITLFVANKKLSLFSHFKIGNISRVFRKNLGQYAVMTLFSTVVFPLVFLGIRNFIIAEVGTEEAGYWEALNRLSNYYLLFTMSLLSLYVLPKLSQTHKDSEFRKTVFEFNKTVLPLFAIGLLLIYFLRFWLIKVFLSEEFLPSADLFKWQLIGDFIKVAIMVVVMQLHAKKMALKYILSDMFLAAMLYFSSTFLVSNIGLEGVVIAHLLTYLLYGLVILFIFRKVFFYKLFK